MDNEIYTERIIELAESGHIPHKYNRSSNESSAYCGDEQRVYLLVKEGIVVDAGFEGDGCVLSRASSKLLTDYIKGKSIKDVLGLTIEDVESLLGFSVSMARRNCASLGLKAVKSALIKDEQSNTPNREQ